MYNTLIILIILLSLVIYGISFLMGYYLYKINRKLNLFLEKSHKVINTES
jgi:hypothetical protein